MALPSDPERSKEHPSDAKNNRTDEFLRLLLSNQRRIHGFILTMIPNWSDADDIMQDTTSEMWKNFDRFERGTDFVAWGMTVAKYQVLRFLKRHRDGRLCFSDELLEAVATESGEADRHLANRLDALERCVSRLSDRDRELIRLRYEAGNTTKNVASRVGRPVQGVYKAMARIHNALLDCVRQSLLSSEVSR